MLFTEPAFVFFLLPLLLGLYYVTPRRLRNGLLLVASLFFYWWGEKLFFLMVISIVINYSFGLVADKRTNPRWAKTCMILGVAANLVLLGVYKYGEFAIEIVDDLVDLLGGAEGDGKAALAWMLAPLGLSRYVDRGIRLPIGISFFTFQAMSYMIDVYRGDAEKQRNPLNLGLYVALFPQLIAGPIVRYHHVAAQLLERRVDFERLATGLERFIVGLGKKMLLANTVGATAELIFGLPTAQLSPGLAWLGITCFIVQLYFDFSGYSDMAIGLGRIFGFDFPENFNYPYISRSITEMWRRWHMTLGNWLRDYLYIPLGGSRVAAWRVYCNLIVTFLLCGLWHGAHWNFLIWGAWNGVFLLLERSPFGRWLGRWPAPLAWAYTMLSWMGGLVIFKAGDPKLGGDMARAGAYLLRMVGLGEAREVVPIAAVCNWEMGLGLVAGTVACFPMIPWLTSRYRALREGFADRRRRLLDHAWQDLRVIALVLVLYASVLLVASGAYNPFLYFQF